MNKHTKTPWVIKRYYDNYDVETRTTVETEDGMTIAQVVYADRVGCGKEVYASGMKDIELISAAPEMLDALKSVNQLIADCAMSGFTDKSCVEALFLSQQKTSDAIKKAKGEA